ncbi:MAG: retropepsin-like aspartic protease [Pontixanthobacter sp.]
MTVWTYWAAALLAAQPATPVDIPLAEAASLPDPEPAASTYDDEIVAGETDYYERMTVPVTIEGKGPFRFMIDTGAQATVVTRGLTEQLDLQPIGSATLIAMGSSRPVQLFELNGLEFAQRVFDDISAPMLEARHVGADGILGLDSLQDLRVMIDFRDDSIAVNDSAALGGNRGFEIIVRARQKLGRLIITSAKIDGVSTAVVLDTGAQSSFGNSALRRRLRARNSEETTSTDVNGVATTGYRHYTKTLQIQEMQLNNLPITFAESPVFAALGLAEKPALILGMRDLRLFDRVAIDFASRMVLFDLPRGSRLGGNTQG